MPAYKQTTLVLSYTTVKARDIRPDKIASNIVKPETKLAAEQKKRQEAEILAPITPTAGRIAAYCLRNQLGEIIAANVADPLDGPEASMMEHSPSVQLLAKILVHFPSAAALRSVPQHSRYATGPDGSKTMVVGFDALTGITLAAAEAMRLGYSPGPYEIWRDGLGVVDPYHLLIPSKYDGHVLLEDVLREFEITNPDTESYPDDLAACTARSQTAFALAKRLGLLSA